MRYAISGTVLQALEVELAQGKSMFTNRAEWHGCLMALT